jgi:histidine triad (HIT) family protein
MARAGSQAPRPCTFCAVVRGEIATEIVAETTRTIAFLDHRPVFRGHTLVVPRDHVETLRELPDALLVPLFSEVRRIAAALQDGLGADGTFVAENNVVSQSVPHLHVHVVPRRRKDGLRGFFWPRERYGSPEEAAEFARRIRAALGNAERTNEGFR